MTHKDQTDKAEIPRPSAEQIEQALAGVQTADDVVAALKGLVGDTLSAMLTPHWELILKQLAIRFGDRLPL